ncbi:DNA topoisomerase IV, alpha subunit [Calocera cornea HHB12733]|uniref:DNA topoisomerase IV, alpha subunit n=1 Tax=Calocera cornea HHB12733 TaxID=1353952 RepID=A0A165GX74_9BASI|nr:DNA topoisomerase IV, alpha subunit [Calocera cornea HHB12733]
MVFDMIFSDGIDGIDDDILAMGETQDAWDDPPSQKPAPANWTYHSQLFDDDVDEGIRSFQAACADSLASPSSPLLSPSSVESSDPADSLVPSSHSSPILPTSEDSQIVQSQSPTYVLEVSDNPVYNKLSELKLTILRQLGEPSEMDDSPDEKFRDPSSEPSQLEASQLLEAASQLAPEALQKKTFNLIEKLALKLGVSRDELNIRASPRGMFAGSALKLYTTQGDVITASATMGRHTPAWRDIDILDVHPDIAFVLVVEKEAVFQTLLAKRFADHPFCNGKGLIITGKGYPDLATRDIFKALATLLPMWIPITVLVDADPYGIEILAQYIKHCGPHVGKRVQWIGVFGTEWSDLGVDLDDLLPMKPGDNRKALKMLRAPDLPYQWRKEFEYMLFTQRKAEIECLASISVENHIIGASQASSSGSSQPLVTRTLSVSSPLSSGFCFLQASQQTTVNETQKTSITETTFCLSQPTTFSKNPGDALVQYLIQKISPLLLGADACQAAAELDLIDKAKRDIVPVDVDSKEEVSDTSPLFADYALPSELVGSCSVSRPEKRKRPIDEPDEGVRLKEFDFEAGVESLVKEFQDECADMDDLDAIAFEATKEAERAISAQMTVDRLLAEQLSATQNREPTLSGFYDLLDDDEIQILEHF